MRTIRRRNPSDQSDVNWGRGMFIAGATRIAPYKGPYAEDLLKRVPLSGILPASRALCRQSRMPAQSGLQRLKL